MLLALALYAATAHAASPPDSVERRASSTRTPRTTTSSVWGVGGRLKEHDPRIKIVSISSHCEDTFTSKTSVPEWDRQFRLVRVHHEHREELGRLRLAGIGADAMAVAGQLGEGLSGLVGRHRS